MVDTAQVLSIGLVVAVTAAGAWLMNMFFGLVGVVLLLGLTGVVVVIVGVLAGGNASQSGTQSSGRQSKGARESGED